jgi:hypothetical protein
LTVAASVKVPGYSNPIALASDSAEPGVWFLAENATDVSVFRWDGATSTLQRYSLGNPTSGNLVFGVQAALAVSPNGTVWAGINSTLIRLDPSTGAIRIIPIPTPADNAIAESHRPPQIQGVHDIEAIAVNSAGNLAVATSASNSVEFYNDTTQEFAQMSLAGGGEPLDLAYLSDGTLGIATTDWDNPDGGGTDLVELVGPSGQLGQAHVDATNISAGGTAFVVTAGGSSLAQVAPGSSLDPTSNLSATNITNIPVSNMQLLVGSPALSFGNGSVLASTKDGFVKLNLASQQAVAFDLPTYSCSGLSVPPQPGGPSVEPPVTKTCQSYPLSYSVDVDGNVWFTSSGAGSTVNEISSGSF